MDHNTAEIAKNLLEGGELPSGLTAFQLEDVIEHIGRYFEGEDGLARLVSGKNNGVIIKALKSEPGEPFHGMALKELGKAASASLAGFSYLTNNSELFTIFIAPLDDETDLLGSTMVQNALVGMAKRFPVETLNIFFSKEPKTSNYASFFSQLVHSDSPIIKMRGLELFASLSEISDGWFNMLEQEGVLKIILSEIESDDLLVRLNAAQLLAKVALSSNGINLMEKENIPTKLVSIIEDETSSMILANFVTLLGEMASQGSPGFEAVVIRNPSLMSILHKNLEHDNDEVVQAVIFAVARISSTREGLIFILSPPNSILLRYWFDYGHSSNAEMRSTVFYALVIILEKNWGAEDDELNDGISNLKLLYSKLGFTDYPSIEVIHKNLNGALSELKVAAMTLLKGMVRYQWGIEEIIRYPGMIEWLINRSTENSLRGHQLKYDILHTAIKHPKAKETLGINNYHLFVEYLKLGVYYQRSQAATLVKGQHS